MSGKGLHIKVNVPGKGSTQNSPASQLGTRLPIQDFEKLRRKHLAENTLFEDPYFPADQSSLFYSQKLPFTPKWIRPGDIVSKPQLYTGGASRFDVEQGMLGDCWLVAAIASLTQDKIMLKKVIPDDQSFEKGYAGIFHFRFWHFGEWVDIVVDDLLPTHNGKLIFIHSVEDNEFWSALLEKAYAKLYGGYESLKGGKTSEAMVDFTGGVVEAYDLTSKELDKADLFQKLVKNAKRSSLMSASIRVTGKQDIEAKLSNGLVKGHAYSANGATLETVRGKELKLIRLRNPWGEKEWNGDWSDDSGTWKQLPEARRKALQSKDEDGEFWMSYDDFLKNYTDFEICSVSVDQMYEDENVKNWNFIAKNGVWDAAKETAGGCRNYPTFVKNPQFVIELTEDDDGDGKSSCLIALMQKNRRKQKKMGAQDLAIGFSVYKAPPDGSTTLTKQFVDYNRSAGTSGSFTNAREVYGRFDFDPGTYIILPCSFKPGEEGEFLLRIFTEKSSKSGGGATGGGQISGKMKVVFERFGGSDGKIDAEELQDMMTMTLSSDMSKPVFSLEVCKAMIAMIDRDKNGTLDLAEFEALLKQIAEWKKMYFKFDRDRSGSLEKNEVHEAVRSLGYPISSEAFNILFNRFSTRRRYMKLDDFIGCICRVKSMNDTFEKLNNFKSEGSISLTQDQFLKITLDA